MLMCEWVKWTQKRGKIMGKSDFQIPVKKNEYIEATAEDLTHQGAGVCKVDNYPLFVEGLLPGEKAKIKVIKVGKTFGFGRLISILTESPERVEVVEKSYTQVGIMPLQHLSYTGQLAFKQQQVKNVFERIAHMPDVVVEETIGMDHPYEYRNKAQVPVRTIRGQLETGFFRKNTHQLIPLEDFQIQDPEIDKALIVVRDLLRKYNIHAYDEETHKGVVRHIVVRRGHYTGELMIVLVTRVDNLLYADEIVAEILEKLPETVSIIQNTNSLKTNVILGRKVKVLYGKDAYTDKLMGLTFEISHQSFYQVNPTQAEVLYAKALEFADLTGTETVIDAYCGIGTLTLVLAQKGKQVHGIEIIAPAIENARKNAKLNKIDNVSFDIGSADDVMKQWIEHGQRADVIVVDPPRKGLDEDFIEAAISMNPSKLVYVSCNPSTLARDAALFAEGGYEVKKVQPIDLFPQTIHVELVALMSKVDE